MLKIRDSLVLHPRTAIRYLIVVFVIAFAVHNYVLWRDTKSWDLPDLHISKTPKTSKTSWRRHHPIEKLMIDARIHHEVLMSKRSRDLASAASRYRERRGRHPPPGFDKWVQAALESDAVIVEDFFDRIYKDLTPYWALESDTLAKRASAWHFVVKVRNGTAKGVGNVEGLVPWLQLWTALVEEFAKDLPDLDMPINHMDESRILVPFNDMHKLVLKEQSIRKIVKPANVTTKFKGLGAVDAAKPEPYDPAWHGPDKSYWSLAVKTCGPDTPAYGVEAFSNFTEPAQIPENWAPDYAYQGFIQNWTAAMDPCLQPHLRQLHGTFVEPISLSSTEELIPLFGGSKLPMNNEILIPGAMYLSADEFYSGGDNHGLLWEKKKNGLIWRGDASGGRARPESWHHFHRHRLIDMLNATTVARMEEGGERARTFVLPPKTIYKSPYLSQNNVSSWLQDFADAGFVRLCPPDFCEFMAQHFQEQKHVHMKEQYSYKFLPDADGNSFSARFRGFLRSTSLPLKATIYTEWHDDRLTPWLHFVPLDNTFQDLYSVLEYFTDGPEGVGDAAAEFIAENGREWAEKVHRREDMRLYVWRLLLEWARICDENRETLGFIEDLIS